MWLDICKGSLIELMVIISGCGWVRRWEMRDEGRLKLACGMDIVGIG